jgi:hypothetical protein
VVVCWDKEEEEKKRIARRTSAWFPTHFGKHAKWMGHPELMGRYLSMG